MKANEVMIGDWVLLNDLYWQVSAIFDDGYVKLKRWSEKQNQELEYLCKIDLVRPISLTEEILNANGIDYESEVGIIKKIGGHIHIRGWMANCELYLGMIRYVHELQHALRLCGLNELADNFKLE